MEELEIGIPKGLLKAATKNIVNLKPHHYENLKNWVCHNPSGGVVFTGMTGRGKSYAAVAIMYFLKHIKKIPWHEQRFIDVPELNQKWLASIGDYVENQNLAYKLKNCRVLVLDDLGTKKPTDGFLDYIFNIVNHRTNDQYLITIYTTNLGSKELNDTIGARLVSRISSGLVIKFEGVDLRQIQNTYQEPTLIIA